MPATLFDHEPALGEWVSICLQQDRPSLAGLDMTKHVGSKKYAEEIGRLQHELQKVALSYFGQGRKAVVLFEGSDAAGKGGAIRRMSWPLDPRSLTVWPISAPTPEEKGQAPVCGVARGYAGRDLAVKFVGNYHGHVDSLLVKAGSGLAMLGMSDSAGVPAGNAETTLPNSTPRSRPSSA